MSDTGLSTPANFWRVFVLVFPTCFFAAAPVSPPNELSQINKPGPVEAAEFLEEFRQSGLPGNYYLEFELHVLPRRGETRVFGGRLWGGGTQPAALNRVEAIDGDGNRHVLLVQSGEHPAIWRVNDGEVRQLGVDALFAPLIPGVEMTAFDLQRSYLYWADATLQSIHRVLGRPAYAYLFRPPVEFSSGAAGVVAVRTYFDTQFKQPLQSELLDASGKVLKTFSVVSLKTVETAGAGGAEKQTLPREVDFRNETTRDKTRLEITAVAFNVSLPQGIFDPAGLAGRFPTPLADRLIRLTP